MFLSIFTSFDLCFYSLLSFISPLLNNPLFFVECVAFLIVLKVGWVCWLYCFFLRKLWAIPQTTLYTSRFDMHPFQLPLQPCQPLLPLSFRSWFLYKPLLYLSIISQPQSSDFMQNLPVVAPGILSWNEKDLKELFISTTRDIISQINAVKGDWADIVR